MCEEKEGVMRNAMTTRAPGGANKVIIGPGWQNLAAFRREQKWQ